MTLEEFKKQVYHTKTSVVIPSLNRFRVDKTQFFVKGKFKQTLLDEYLEQVYKKNYK